MKKIMFALALVACAATMQAAQFDWVISNVREGWDDPNTKANGTAYLFLVGGDVTEASIASAISGASDTTALASTLAGKAIDTKEVTAGAGGGTTPGGLTATAPASLFFVVVSGDNVYQGGAVTVDTIAAIGSTEVAFGSQKSATSAASAWSTVGGGSGGGGGGSGGVPEPTSGLLLLVGGAMLALRRKQK